jgi:hypothetical protein
VILPSSQPLEERIDLLNKLLDRCEGLTSDRHLRPYHLVASINVSESLEEGIFSLFGEWGYKRHPESRLILKKVLDWKVEIENAPFFWAGFKPVDKVEAAKFAGPVETPEHVAVRAAFIELVSGIFSADAQAYGLSSSDASGRSLNPGGGLHDYFVLVEGASSLLIDFDWDS